MTALRPHVTPALKGPRASVEGIGQAKSGWPERVQRWREPIKVGLSLVGLGVLVLLLTHHDQLGSDTRSYWGVDAARPYADAVGNLSAPIAFRYAPPLALLLAPFGAIPWPLFSWLWTGSMLACLWYVCRSWTLAAIALYPVALELSAGNIHLFLAAALVAGSRWPIAWALLPLTKVTPVIVFLWFAARREWRSLALAAGATLAMSLVSFVVAPDIWGQWLMMLASNVGAPSGISIPVPLWVRLPVAAIVVVWGARSDRHWVLAVGLLLSIPTLWPHALAVLLALWRQLPRWASPTAPEAV